MGGASGAARAGQGVGAWVVNGSCNSQHGGGAPAPGRPSGALAVAGASPLPEGCILAAEAPGSPVHAGHPSSSTS